MGHWGEHCSQVFQNAKREVNFLSNSYLVANNHDFGSGGEDAWIEMNMTNGIANINVDLIIETAMMMIMVVVILMTQTLNIEERLIRTSGHNNDDFDDNGNATIEYYC